MDYRSKGASLVAGAFQIATLFLSATPSVAEIPQAITVPGEIPATLLHAEGAQIYQCAAGPHNQLVWQPREPLATLRRGRTCRADGRLHGVVIDPGATKSLFNVTGECSMRREAYQSIMEN